MGVLIRCAVWAFLFGVGFTLFIDKSDAILSPFGLISVGVVIFAVVAAINMLRK